MPRRLTGCGQNPAQLRPKILDISRFASSLPGLIGYWLGPRTSSAPRSVGTGALAICLQARRPRRGCDLAAPC